MAAIPPFDADLLRRYDRPGPRYTSYPTAPQFKPGFGETDFARAARLSNDDPIPRRLSLYAHVSKVTWQFEAPARVAGTVCNPLRTFDYDPGTTPNFEIVNSLWDLMGTEDA